MCPGGNRFSRRDRLRRPEEFRRVFASRLQSADGAMRVLAAPNDLGYPRLGMAVPRKSVPRAVQRNRIKRVIREAFRENRDRLDSLDVVVVARPGIVRLDGRALRTALLAHWARLGSRACAGS